MTRRAAIIVALLVLALLLIVAGRRYVERVPVTIRRGASMEVRRQPRLALERLLARGGLEPRHVVLDDAFVDVAPPEGVLLLDEADAALSRSTQQALWNWVARGGTLMLSPIGTPAGDLSRRLGVRLRTIPPMADDDADAPQVDRTTLVVLPARARRYRIDPVHGFLLSGAPTWSAGDGRGGLAIAEVPHERGRVIVVADLASLWTNDRIGQREHASLLWALVGVARGTGPVLFTATAPPRVTWTDVARQGWMTLVAAGVLAVAALWHVLPRAAPALSPPPPARRRLGEHLDAVGRFLLRAHGQGELVDAARRAVDARLRRQPWHRRDVDPQVLHAAPATDDDFLQTMRRLRETWRRFRHE